MEKDKSFTVEGRQLDLRRVRKQADKMGIQGNIPLPEVIIVGKDADEQVQGGPSYTQTHLERPPQVTLLQYLRTL